MARTIWLNEGVASWMARNAPQFNPQWEGVATKEFADPTDVRYCQEQAMEGDAIDNASNSTARCYRGKANSADDITYKGAVVPANAGEFSRRGCFRDESAGHIAAHEYSNSTTADLWNALRSFEKPAARSRLVDRATGFLVKASEKKRKSPAYTGALHGQFQECPAAEWRIPLTTSLKAPATLLMTNKIDAAKHFRGSRSN